MGDVRLWAALGLVLVVSAACGQVEKLDPDASGPGDDPDAAVADFDAGQDTTAPEAPVLSATAPASPAPNPRPDIVGSTEPNATVEVFATASCSGGVVATQTANPDGTFSIQVDAVDNDARSFTATATDAADNTSPCSNAIEYVHDNIAPGRPTLASTLPASPANDPMPTVTGAGEPGATLEFFSQAGCTGTALGTVEVGGGGGFATAVTVLPNDTTVLSARAIDNAGNASPCSLSLAYLHDGIAPSAPALVETTPASPANDNAPTLLGTAEAGATVQVFTDNVCMGAVLDTATADGGTFSLVLSLANDSTTTLRARAIDAAGNQSPCSAGLVYVEDSTAPPTPTLATTAPTSPANNNAPTLTGTAEAGATLELYTTAGCTGTAVAATTVPGSGAFAVALAVADNTTTTFRAAATDAAGNRSGCSAGVTYTEDSVAPPPPVVGAMTPLSPANNNAPSIAGTAEAGAIVRIFGDPACTVGPFATVVATGGGSFTATTPVGDDTMTFMYASAEDAAGNQSACSSTFTWYVEDSPGGTPSISGRINYGGGETGPIFITASACCSEALAGTSIPGPGPYLIRGVNAVGTVDVEAWMDVVGVNARNLSVDPNASTSLLFGGGSAGGVNLTLANPITIGLPGTVDRPTAIGASSFGLVFWDDDNAAPVEQFFVYLSSTPSPGPGNFDAVRVIGAPSERFVVFEPLAPGTYFAAVFADLGGFHGPASPDATFTVGAPTAGASATGTLTFTDFTPSGTTYAVAIDESTGRMGLAIVDTSTNPTSWTIPGLADGTYEVVAIVDDDDNGHVDLDEPATFRSREAKPLITVAGGDVAGPDLTIDGAGALVTVRTQHHTDGGGDDRWNLELRGVGNTRRVMTATIVTGPNIPLPLDLGHSPDRGEATMESRQFLDSVEPNVGDSYEVVVRYDDHTTDTFSFEVTGIVEGFARLLAPVGSSADDADPQRPTFDWDPVSPAPPGAFRYQLDVREPDSGGDGIWRRTVDAAITSLLYNDDGTADQDALTSGTTYQWSVTTEDDFGNASTAFESFEVP